jgi:1-acyl-sn-glycerol-3-phosphate acyltransferase
LHFHAALLQPAIACGSLAHPASLRYLDADGRRSRAVSYVGDETLMGSVWQLLGAQAVIAHVAFGSPEPAEGRNRRELAAALHAAISLRLDLGTPRTEPGTGAGLPA